MDLQEKTIENNYVFKGKVINVRNDLVSLPNGKIAGREIVEHNGGCAIVAIDDGYIYLVEQYRYAYDEVLLEIPAGKLEKGEDPKICAIRELEEETGLVASKIELLNKVYPSCGYTNEVISIFMAENFEQGKSCLDEDEFLNVKKIDFSDALKMVFDGKIKDAKTIIGITNVALMKTIK